MVNVADMPRETMNELAFTQEELAELERAARKETFRQETAYLTESART